MSHLCSAKHQVGEEAQDLHLLRAAQDSFAVQHPEPQTAASATWQEAAQRQLLSSLSILGLGYFTKLESCFYKPWVYSFLVVNLTMVDWGYCFPVVAHLSDSESEMIHLKTQGHWQGIIFGNGQTSNHCNSILRSHLYKGREDDWLRDHKQLCCKPVWGNVPVRMSIWLLIRNWKSWWAKQCYDSLGPSNYFLHHLNISPLAFHHHFCILWPKLKQNKTKRKIEG